MSLNPQNYPTRNRVARSWTFEVSSYVLGGGEVKNFSDINPDCFNNQVLTLEPAIGYFETAVFWGRYNSGVGVTTKAVYIARLGSMDGISYFSTGNAISWPVGTGTAVISTLFEGQTFSIPVLPFIRYQATNKNGLHFELRGVLTLHARG